MAEAPNVSSAPIPADRYVTVNGLRIHYLDWGSHGSIEGKPVDETFFLAKDQVLPSFLSIATRKAQSYMPQPKTTPPAAMGGSAYGGASIRYSTPAAAPSSTYIAPVSMSPAPVSRAVVSPALVSSGTVNRGAINSGPINSGPINTAVRYAR